MKSHLVLIIFVLILSLPTQILPQQVTDSVSTEVFSPFHKGTYALSGSVSYSRTSVSSGEQTSAHFTMSPAFLYFTSKKFALGGQVIYTITTYKDRYNDSQSSVLGVGPQFRLYLFENEPLIFCTVGIFATSSSSESGQYNYDGPTQSLAVASVGMDIFVNTHFSLEPYLEYKTSLEGNSASAYTMTFGVSFVSFNF